MIEKGEFFNQKDRYLFESYEQALFHWDHQARTIHMKFLGEEHATMVDFGHRIFNDAIRGGREITKAEFDAAQVIEK